MALQKKHKLNQVYDSTGDVKDMKYLHEGLFQRNDEHLINVDNRFLSKIARSVMDEVSKNQNRQNNFCVNISDETETSKSASSFDKEARSARLAYLVILLPIVTLVDIETILYKSPVFVEARTDLT